MASHFLPDASGSTGRPELLTTLGVMSFINCGFFLPIYFFGLLFMFGLRAMPEERFMEEMQAQMDGMSGLMGEAGVAAYEEILPILYHGGVLLMAVLLVRTIARFVGVLAMWRGRRQGFTIYAAAQASGIFLPHLVLPWKYLGLFGPFMAMGFVLLYRSQLRRMA